MFGKLVVAEVLPEVVSAVRTAGGMFTVNIAHLDGVEQARIGPIQIEDPAQEADRDRLVAAIAEAVEIATAIPSVAYYAGPTASSLHRVLAQGLRRKAATGGPRAVIYAAENHNHAAEMLEAHVMNAIPVAERESAQARVRFLNTVIGKMSGIVTDPAQIGAWGLVPTMPDDRRVFLVEAFNHILVSKTNFDTPFERGITVFEEKPDLLPFEEAKLYGHNSTHALAAYLGAVRGVRQMADLPDVPGLIAFVREAFIEESGAALIRKHAGVDSLFTPDGYAAYADNLLARMINTYLHDTVERVGRDPARKLGWNDRLIGTMRVALAQGIIPRRYAIGAAAALAALDATALDGELPVATWLDPLWKDAAPSANEREVILGLIEAGRRRLRCWRDTGFAALSLDA